MIFAIQARKDTAPALLDTRHIYAAATAQGLMDPDPKCPQNSKESQEAEVWGDLQADEAET